MAKPTRSKNSDAERHTGQQSKLKFQLPDGGETYEIPITNVSWSRSTQTTTSQHNDDLLPVHAVTGVRFSGSFEYSGRNWEAMNKLIYGAPATSGGAPRHTPVRGTLTVKESSSGETYTYTFKRTIVTSNGRDVPGSDQSSTSYDFQAEDMVLMKNGSNPERP